MNWVDSIDSTDFPSPCLLLAVCCLVALPARRAASALATLAPRDPQPADTASRRPRQTLQGPSTGNTPPGIQAPKWSPVPFSYLPQATRARCPPPGPDFHRQVPEYPRHATGHHLAGSPFTRILRMQRWPPPKESTGVFVRQNEN